MRRGAVNLVQQIKASKGNWVEDMAVNRSICGTREVHALSTSTPSIGLSGRRGAVRKERLKGFMAVVEVNPSGQGETGRKSEATSSSERGR